jgi:hypothetical protein
VLATPEERRVNVLPNMESLLVLDDWHHPDLANGEWPSALESFQQLARVLATGDTRHYCQATRIGHTGATAEHSDYCTRIGAVRAFIVIGLSRPCLWTAPMRTQYVWPRLSVQRSSGVRRSCAP